MHDLNEKFENNLRNNISDSIRNCLENNTNLNLWLWANLPLFRVCGHGISSSIELALLKIKGTK